MTEETKNVTLKAKRAFSGAQTSATYLGRIEEHETFEATEDDAQYLVRNGFAERVEAPVETAPETEGATPPLDTLPPIVTPDATIERDERDLTTPVDDLSTGT